MANALGELFGNIATSIRAGLDDVGKMKPASFPEKIDEIVGKIGSGSGDMDDILDMINGEVVGENIYTVTFKQYDGSVTYGSLQVVENDECPNPITKKVFDKPTRESTVEHDFSFIGWSTEPNGTVSAGVLSKITEDVTLYAVYSNLTRSYTIAFFDDANALNVQTVKYGATPTISAPEKYGYMFDKWQPEIVPVTGDANYYAQWIQGSFSAASWTEIARICEEGKAQDYFAVGDEKVVETPSGNAVVKVAGFKHDTCADDGSKASLTIILGTVVDLQHTYNETNDSDTYVYWEESQLRSVIASIENVLPQDLRDVIVPVIKQYDEKVVGWDEYSKSTDRLWALCPHELGFGTSSYSSCKKYELYENPDNRKLSRFGDDTKVKYYLRTIFSPLYWEAISEEGTTVSIGKGESAYIHFGFCIK